MRLLKLITPVFASVFLLTACCQIDYQGESMQPVPEKENITLYFAKEQLPAGEQKLLGTAVAEAGTTWTQKEIENRLRDFAREKGANTVLIKAVDKIPAGTARKDQLKNQQAKQWDVTDNSHNSFDFFRWDMLTYSDKESENVEISNTRITAELLYIPETEAAETAE